jgi:hypothetical protein
MIRAAALLLLFAIAGCRRADENRFIGATDSVAANPVVLPDSAARSCGVGDAPRLDEDGIGELKQGRPISEVALLCEVISDTGQRGPDGKLERVAVVRIAGEIVRAVVVNDRVSQIEINTPRFRTTDSLGVDTPLHRIAAKRGAEFAPGEDAVYGFTPEHCGLSFRFSVPLRPPAGGQWSTRQIESEHGDAAVNRVIVVQCRR